MVRVLEFLPSSFLLQFQTVERPLSRLLPFSLLSNLPPPNAPQKAVLTSRSSTVNIIIVLLDVTILGLEYSGLYDIQTVYKGLAYSVKLKLEFSILNRLVELTQGRFNSSSSNHNSHERSVHLDTFDEQRLKRLAAASDKEAGYRAYVTSDGVDAVAAARHDDSIVITTTQVAIRSESCPASAGGVQRYGDWRDNDKDLESLDELSVGSGPAGENQGRLSASSQVQLARVET